MASFQSFLHVSSQKYEILNSDLFIHQEIDVLGRPASPTFGGIFTIEINTPDDSILYEWMVSPTKIMSGKVVLKQIGTNITLKVIKFYNAYCVGMDVSFDGRSNAARFTTTIRISPEQMDVAGIFHDNRWPDETPVPYVSDSDGPIEPGLWSDVAHGVLDVVGLIPVVGELADGANALFYLAEGNKTDAALSAAAMIPIAGWAATGAKVVRKGVKIANKARGLKKVKANRVKQLWQVGQYEKLRNLKPGLDAHHVGQKALMSKFIPGYDPLKGPSILVPKAGHTIKGVNGIVSRSTKGFSNARQVLARDIRELRRVYPTIPKSALKELIELNKKMYPKEFKRIN
jgi:Hemolysin coregulated protein Hcp (TssD)